MSTPRMGWYRDPSGVPQLRFWDGRQWGPQTAPLAPVAVPPAVIPAGGPGSRVFSSPPPLDVSVAALRERDPAPWGRRPVVVPIVATVVLIVAGQILAQFAPAHGSSRVVYAAVLSLGIEAVLAGALYFAGRSVAARAGGWGAAFGWRRPVWSDLVVALVAFCAATGIRVALGVALNLASNGRATKQAMNLHPHSVTPLGVTALFLLAVVAAPLTEEFMFRGLLLRTFMRRWSFWPAALTSAAIFGLFHTYEVSTLLGAATLAISVGAMGLVNCVVVRRTDRLAPAIMVHAASNALALVIAIAAVHSTVAGR
jgi:membrane protease YdiL (CAAX protease family)